MACEEPVPPENFDLLLEKSDILGYYVHLVQFCLRRKKVTVQIVLTNLIGLLYIVIFE